MTDEQRSPQTLEEFKARIEDAILRLLASNAKIVTPEMISGAVSHAVDNPASCISIAYDQVKKTALLQISVPPRLADIMEAEKAKHCRAAECAGYPSYDVLIRKNATGEVRTSHQDLPWKEHSLWSWTEGNFGCDCNRKLQFERAGKEEGAEDYECGHSAYTVIKAIFPDGKELAIDEATVEK